MVEDGVTRDVPEHARARRARGDLTRLQRGSRRGPGRGDRGSRRRRDFRGASFTRVKWCLPVLAAAAIAAAGCGGGGGTPLSKSEFITRGDAICTKYRTKNQALNKQAPAKNPTDPSASDEQVKASAPILRKLSDNVSGARGEFSDLDPPDQVIFFFSKTLLRRVRRQNLRAARGRVREAEPSRRWKSDWENTLDDLDQIAADLDDAAEPRRRSIARRSSTVRRHPPPEPPRQQLREGLRLHRLRHERLTPIASTSPLAGRAGHARRVAAPRRCTSYVRPYAAERRPPCDALRRRGVRARTALLDRRRGREPMSRMRPGGRALASRSRPSRRSTRSRGRRTRSSAPFSLRRSGRRARSASAWRSCKGRLHPPGAGAQTRATDRTLVTITPCDRSTSCPSSTRANGSSRSASRRCDPSRSGSGSAPARATSATRRPASRTSSSTCSSRDRARTARRRSPRSSTRSVAS